VVRNPAAHEPAAHPKKRKAENEDENEDGDDPQSLLPLLKPYPAEKMEAYPVRTLVNSPGHESEECVQPIEKPYL